MSEERPVPRRESPWDLPEGDKRQTKAHRCNNRAEDVVQMESHYGVADDFPPPPPLPPSVEALKAEEAKKLSKPKRALISRPGFGKNGKSIQLVTIHFKVSLKTTDEFFHHYYAYIQQLESSRIRLALTEQELHSARAQREVLLVDLVQSESKLRLSLLTCSAGVAWVAIYSLTGTARCCPRRPWVDAENDLAGLDSGWLDAVVLYILLFSSVVGNFLNVLYFVTESIL